MQLSFPAQAPSMLLDLDSATWQDDSKQMCVSMKGLEDIAMALKGILNILHCIIFPQNKFSPNVV